MAQALLRLLRDQDLRARIELQARQTVVEHFDWNGIAERQKRMYDELIEPAYSG